MINTEIIVLLVAIVLISVMIFSMHYNAKTDKMLREAEEKYSKSREELEKLEEELEEMLKGVDPDTKLCMAEMAQREFDELVEKGNAYLREHPDCKLSNVEILEELMKVD